MSDRKIKDKTVPREYGLLSEWLRDLIRKKIGWELKHKAEPYALLCFVCIGTHLYLQKTFSKKSNFGNSFNKNLILGPGAKRN